MHRRGDDLVVRRRDIAIGVVLAVGATVAPAAPNDAGAPPPADPGVRQAAVRAMVAAFERGDVDEAAHRGGIAGAGALARALRSTDPPVERATRLAAIAAAPTTEGRTELLDPLARLAAGPDRRIAIPAARAARAIASELGRDELPDDIAPEDLAAWRRPWAELALRTDRWIEVRVLALDTAAALDREGAGVDLAAALGDRDPDFRRAAVAAVPAPVPALLLGVLANAVVRDTDDAVALAAAQVLCFDLPAVPAKPILDVLGPAGLQRIRTLVGTHGDPATIRDAARCLVADRTPASTAALGTIKRRPRF